MRQVVLLIVALGLIAGAAFVYKSKSDVDTSTLVVRNTGTSILSIAVGVQAPTVVPPGESASDEFVEGVMVRVWPGEKSEGFATGWRIYRVAGEVAVAFDGEAITIAGDGLDFTELNNGRGANSARDSK
jgi:hypothetical protein